jgi:peptide/nickel transport system substrate-binding protein
MSTGLNRISRRSMIEGAGIGALGLAGAALLGCGGGGTGDKTAGSVPAAGRIEGATQGGGLTMIAPVVQGKPRYGGTWRTAGTATGVQWDAHTALGDGGWSTLGEKVLEQHPVTGELQPNLATSWEVADPNGLTLVFKINPDVRIHNKPPWNGRAYTSEDIAWNLERIGGLYAERLKIPPASFQRASMVANLMKAEAVDATTVKATLSKPNSGLFNGLVENRVETMPKEMDDIGYNDPLKLGGVGPFMMTEFAKDQKTNYKKHEQYFRKGEPYFDAYEVIIVPDATAVQAAFISGQTQYLATPTPDAVAVVRQGKPDSLLYATVDCNWQHFRLNLKSYPPFQDFRVRKGIFLATDVAEMANGYYGDGWGYQGVLGPGFPEAWKPDKAQLVPGLNPATKAQDVAEGQKMLAAAGFPNGKGLDFEHYISGDASSVHFANATRFQAQMKRVLPEMQIKLVPSGPGAEFAVRQAEGRFQAIAYTITSVPDAGLELLSQYHTKGSRNYGGFSDPAYDTLVEKVLSELDKNKRLELLEEAQRRWFSDWMAQYVLYAQPRKNMIQSNVGGYDKIWGVWFGYADRAKMGRWYFVDK